MIEENIYTDEEYERLRSKFLSDSKVLDNDISGIDLEKFSSLAMRLLDAQFAYISFIHDKKSIVKSALGITLKDIKSFEKIDLKLTQQNTADVLVVNNPMNRMTISKSFINMLGLNKVMCYAGVSIVVDDVKIGVLVLLFTSIKVLCLEEKEHLLDIGAAISELVVERARKISNAENQRAEIMVSIMHNFRTPVTSLRIATSLANRDIEKYTKFLREKQEADKIAELASVAPTVAAAIKEAELGASKDNEKSPSNESKHTNPTDNSEKTQVIHNKVESVRDPLMKMLRNLNVINSDITKSLSQLNTNIESSIIYGEYVSRYLSEEPLASASSKSNVEHESQKLILTKQLQRLFDVYHKYNKDLKVDWAIENSFLKRGKHIGYPDVILLIFSSILSQISMDWDQIYTFIDFEEAEEKYLDFPEFSEQLVEGKMRIMIQPHSTDGSKTPIKSFLSNDLEQSNYESIENNSTYLNSVVYNFSPIFKLLDYIHGSCTEFEDLENEVKKKVLANTHDQRLRARANLVENQDNGQGKLDQLKQSIRAKNLTLQFSIPCIILKKEFLEMQSGQTEDEISIIHSMISQKKKSYFNGSFFSNQFPVYYSFSDDNILAGPLLHSQADDFRKKSISISEQSDSNNPSLNRDSHGAKSMEDLNKNRTLSVLVIEDTMSIRKLLTRWLQKHGCSVKCAENGKVGLDFLKTHKFDIVLVDFLMPVMLGLTTMKLFKDWICDPESQESSDIIDYNKNTLIIGLSATALESEQEEGFRYGMHLFCSKPANLEILGQIIGLKGDNLTNDKIIDSLAQTIGANENIIYKKQAGHESSPHHSNFFGMNNRVAPEQIKEN